MLRQETHTLRAWARKWGPAGERFRCTAGESGAWTIKLLSGFQSSGREGSGFEIFTEAILIVIKGGCCCWTDKDRDG